MLVRPTEKVGSTSATSRKVSLEPCLRRFVGINPERGSKTCRGKVVSKKTGKLVSKKSATVNPKVASLLKNLIDFEWNFV
jgi:hypothetical protein